MYVDIHVHYNAPLHNTSSIKKWLSQFGVQELEPQPLQQLWDELERQLRAGPDEPGSGFDLTDALLSEWEQIWWKY